MGNKRRTILLNVLIVVLCIAMCVGATFAFFTSSVISSNNKVKSGRLNVDLQLLTKGTEDDWTSIKKDKNPIFGEEILWEPGYTAVKVLKVVNGGDLAIKWEARYASAGELPDIANAIDVYVNTGATANKYPAQRAELDSWAKYSLTDFVNNISTILHGTLEGTQDGEDPKCAYFGIALKMQESAGNEYQGDVLGAFDIQIVATQLTHEDDVFGTDYDENAKFPCNHPVTEIVAGRDATCEDTGLTEGKKCSICKEMIVAQETIPTSGHTESDWIVDVAPTYTSKGHKYTECTVCGKQIQEAEIDTLPYSEGLEYALVEDAENGNYYKVIGMGTYTGTDVIIPATHKDTALYAEELPVKVVGDGTNPFKNGESVTRASITSVSIPNSVTTISENAFQNCTSLASVTFGDGSQPSTSTYALRNRNAGSQLESIGSYAFASCTSLKSIVIPDSVTSIGSSAFAGCGNLESITLPFVGGSVKAETDTFQYPFGYIFGSSSYEGGVATAQKYCRSSTLQTTSTFYIPSGLKSVTITGGNILYGAFYNCSGLTSITIPDSVTSIGNYAFYGCTALANITIPDSVNTIGDCAFYNCSSLTSLTFGAGNKLKTVGASAFNGCTGLTAVHIESLQSWCKIDFNTYGSSNPLKAAHNLYLNGELITELVIPNDVTYVGLYAFAGCTPLTSAIVPDSVTEIRGGIFHGCSNLESLTLPFVGRYGTAPSDFNYTHPFGFVFHTNSYEGGELTKQIYTNNGSTKDYDVYIPTKLKSVTITGGDLPDYAFRNCKNLTSITLPNSVTTIGVSAFYNCTGLEYIKISDNVTSIGRYAFYQCSNLENIAIPDSVATIGEYAFQGCSGLESITISDSVATIGKYAFQGCSSLESITIPDMLTAIELNTFDGCTSLKTVTFGKNSQITSVDYDAFRNCPNITDVYVSNVATWASLSFGGNSTQRPHQNAKLHFLDENGNEVTELVIPDGVTRIGHSAFRNAIYLKTITVPNSVTEIQSVAFSGCGNLESITLPITARKTSSTYNEYASFGCFFGEGSGYGSYVAVTQINENSSSSSRTSTYYFPANLKSVTINGTSIRAYAFSNCSNFTSITFAESVTSISNTAFQGCTGITSLTVDTNNPKYHSAGNCLIETESKTLVLGFANSIIPADGTVTSIGASAFYGRSDLTSITIPEGVTSIGKSAFEGCRSLTSITIPSSVTSIESGYYNSIAGGYAFAGCYHLAEVINHSTLNFVVGSRDYGCVAYYATGIHKGMTTVVNQNDYLFYTCNGVNYLINYLGDDTDLTLPANYNGQNYAIGNYVFYGCKGITSITIPDGVTSIGNSAFSGCTGLTSITIPDGVTSIGNFAFSGCTGLTSVALGNSVNSLGTNVFSGCSQLTSVTLPSSLTIIGDFVFQDWNGLTNITIPDSVTSIGNGAFYNCTGLTNITIPDRVTSIGYNAFYNCTGLTSIIIPDSVANIDFSAFENCTGLTSITIGNGVTSIGSYAFSGCTGLTSITIGNGVTSIGHNAFKGCTALTNITIPDSVTSINYSAFENCTGLTSITIGNGVTSIGYNAFKGCTALTNITIPDSVTSIDYSAFENCTGLTSITIGNGITSIGYKVFNGCTNLVYYEYENGYYLGNDSNPYLVLVSIKDTTATSFTIHEDTKIIYYRAFYNCSSLTNVTIGNSVTSIGNSVFYGCTGLTSITLPNSVITIGAYVFQNCTGLTSVTIPNSVNRIGYYAFDGCTNLTSIVFEDTTSTWYRTTNSSYTSGYKQSVTDAAANVTYFTSTYAKYYWYKQ